MFEEKKRYNLKELRGKTREEIMKKIGVKQLLILKVCNSKGNVSTGDVLDIYHYSIYNGKKALYELRKLELYGYLKPKPNSDNTFILTKKGIDYINYIENFM